MHVPYYADILYEQGQQGAVPSTAPAERSGAGMTDPDDDVFAAMVDLALQSVSGGMAEERPGGRERGVENSRLVLALARALDGSERLSRRGVLMVAADVHAYLHRPGLRDIVDGRVMRYFEPAQPTVVVGHSFGTIVGYSVLRRDGERYGWNVPLFVTLGCPLGITAVRKAFEPNRIPACVGRWWNALDRRDIVALRAIEASQFPGTPSVTNKTNVENETTNRHGIVGYLSDAEVAAEIHRALSV